VIHLLDSESTEGLPLYGSHNKLCPVNGKEVLPLNASYGDGHMIIVAKTVWDGAESGQSVPCMYQVNKPVFTL
jgi:hypothetical protein